MVKIIFSSLSKGFFYTIGRIIALLFIAFVIYTIVTKLSDKYDFDNTFYKPYYLEVF